MISWSLHSRSDMTSSPRSHGFSSEEPGIEVDVRNITKSPLFRRPQQIVGPSESISIEFQCFLDSFLVQKTQDTSQQNTTSQTYCFYSLPSSIVLLFATFYINCVFYTKQELFPLAPPQGTLGFLVNYILYLGDHSLSCSYDIIFHNYYHYAGTKLPHRLL